MGVRFHEHFKGRVPVSCVNGIYEPELARYLIENNLVDTLDLGKAVLADPAFCEAVLNDAPYVRCPERYSLLWYGMVFPGYFPFM